MIIFVVGNDENRVAIDYRTTGYAGYVWGLIKLPSHTENAPSLPPKQLFNIKVGKFHPNGSTFCGLDHGR
jgi:hypothetical protein